MGNEEGQIMSVRLERGVVFIAGIFIPEGGRMGEVFFPILLFFYYFLPRTNLAVCCLGTT